MLKNTNNTSIQHILHNITIILIAIACSIYSAYIAFYYAEQLPLDIYNFRQTQTALTAYWLMKNGFSFAYETPVLGMPWSIPFEFPIYQYIVALISKYLHFSLNATGRIVSYIFLVLCLIPVRSFTKKLQLSDTVFYIFTALLFSSPVYLYWGRTFMIETAAVFFSLMAVNYFIEIINDESSFKKMTLFSIFMSFSLLQKTTTGLPVMIVLGLSYLYITITKEKSLKKTLSNKTNWLIIFSFIVPFVISMIWTLYTDHIRFINPVAQHLTSKVLKAWTFGTLEQRLSFNDLYISVILDRVFNQNLAGMLGITILVIPFLFNIPKKIKLIILIAILMGLLPFFIFTNLHIRHYYYQAANIIFILYAVSVSIGEGIIKNQNKNTIIILLTILMVTSNYFNFEKQYIESIRQKYTAANMREVALAQILKKYIPEDKYFIAFGNDWNSSISYLAERKSFSIPMFLMNQQKDIINHPEKFIPESDLKAVIVIPSNNSISLTDLNQWATNKNWKIGKVSDSYIAIPDDKIILSQLKTTQGECQGSMDTIEQLSLNLFSIAGWTTIAGEKGIIPEKVYVVLSKQNTDPLYFETIQTYRPDVDTNFKQTTEMSSGFSRIIDTSALSGNYTVSIARTYQNKTELCQFKKDISLTANNN